MREPRARQGRMSSVQSGGVDACLYCALKPAACGGQKKAAWLWGGGQTAKGVALPKSKAGASAGTG